MSEASRARIGGARTDRAALLLPRFRPRARFTFTHYARVCLAASVVLEHRQQRGGANHAVTPPRSACGTTNVAALKARIFAGSRERNAVAANQYANTTPRESENVYLRSSVRRGRQTCRRPYIWTRACSCRNLREAQAVHHHPGCNFEKMVYAIPGSGSLHASVPHGIRSAAHV